MARTGSRGKGKSSGSSSSGTGSSGTGSSGTSSSSSSGSSSSSSSSSSGSSSSSSSSSGGGQGGARSSRSSPSPSNATTTSGSSSTTTGANVQSVAVQSTPNYSSIYSANPVTQGAGKGQAPFANNISQTATATASTNQANVTNLGYPPITNISTPNLWGVNQAPISTWNADYQRAPAQYAIMQEKYGTEMANRLATAQYYSPDQVRAMQPSTNTDNQYLQNENRAITNAEKRQQDFVNNNLFVANPTTQPTAPIPDIIYTRTNLYQQAGQDSNPLSILEGNPFVFPQQQFMPQINEEFAPRPQYAAMMSNPYIGVHQNSPLAPNSDIEQNQRKGITEWMMEIRQSKYFPFLIVGVVLLLIFILLRGRKKGGV